MEKSMRKQEGMSMIIVNYNNNKIRKENIMPMLLIFLLSIYYNNLPFILLLQYAQQRMMNYFVS